MSERISIVVPDGTRERLKNRAIDNGYSQSAFTRKVILDVLKHKDGCVIISAIEYTNLQQQK